MPASAAPRSLLIGLLVVLGDATSFAQNTSPNEVIPRVAARPGQVTVRVENHMATISTNDQAFAEYDCVHFAKPILYPLVGPRGIAVTRNYPMQLGVAGEPNDHEHHKSCWFAHGDVNGLDFWSEKARIQNRELGALPQNGQWPGLFARNEWLDGDQPILGEETTIRFADQGDVRFVDFEFVLTAMIDVKFGDTKEGTFAIRTHPNLQLRRDDPSLPVAHAQNSEGKTDGAIWGQRAEWVTYFGEIDGQNIGVALFDHPSNLRHPTTWHARDYGLVAANPFGLHDFLKAPAGDGDYQLEKGHSLKFRYRIAIYLGQNSTEKISAWAKNFSEAVGNESEK